MHLIVAYAAPPSATANAAVSALATPALDTLLARWGEVRRDVGDETTLSPPHERAHAAALGLTGADGCLPWAARQAAIDGVDVGSRSWGLVTPVHWRVGSDGVHLADPAALALSDADSRTLWAAVQPLFESEGYATAWGATLRWYAAHESLQGLATASLDRVIGRNVNAWLPRQPEARRLRRLQNEIQMLLHGHALNEAREAAGRLVVNSFWLSGCGAARPDHAGDVRFDDRLRGPALQGNGAAWHEAWKALDADAIAPLLAAATTGAAVRVTLCGERGSVELAPRQRAWWQSAFALVSPARPKARTLLEPL
jgi:hypothetical protein